MQKQSASSERHCGLLHTKEALRGKNRACKSEMWRCRPRTPISPHAAAPSKSGDRAGAVIPPWHVCLLLMSRFLPDSKKVPMGHCVGECWVYPLGSCDSRLRDRAQERRGLSEAPLFPLSKPPPPTCVPGQDQTPGGSTSPAPALWVTVIPERITEFTTRVRYVLKTVRSPC